MLLFRVNRGHCSVIRFFLKQIKNASSIKMSLRGDLDKTSDVS